MYKKYISKYSVKRKFLLILIYLFIYIPLIGQINNHDDYHLKTVVIDPGHGGKDPGSVGNFSCEKDIVLAIALKLGKYIETKLDDVKVIYTRTTDEFVPLYKRAEIANNSKADLFLSIHANGLEKKEAMGTETLVLGLHRAEENFEVAKRENSVIRWEEDYTTRYEGFDPDSPESYIMLTLMQSVYFDQSINLAKNIQDQFRDRARRYDRGVKQQGLLVLAQTSMPGVLIETGFITNPEEEKYLMSEEGQDFIASAIFRAFRDYKQSIESRSIFAYVSSGTRTDTLKHNEDNPDTDGNPVVMDDTAASSESPMSVNDEAAESHEKSADNNIEFKVQIAVSSNPIPLDSDFFKELNDVWEYKQNHLYKYAVGSKKNYNEIIEYSKWIKNRFPDAFVIAVKNGKIISMEQALKESVMQTN
jgi:N-acetylmuramoyl-L-alanine amidase